MSYEIGSKNVAWEARLTWTRMPGWHRSFSREMLIALDCQDGGSGDANLGAHVSGKMMEKIESEKNSRPESGRDLLPDVLRDRGAASAVVELLDTTAMRRIIDRCYDQTDTRRLSRVHMEEFKRASDECQLGLSPGVLMQVWSGCLAAAKAISPTNYWIGPISPWFRFNIFRNGIFPTCSSNAVYRLGALAAPHFKIWRREPITLRGVPLALCDDPDFLEWRKIKEFS